MPVIVFYGEERYLLDKAVAELRAKTVDPAMASLTHKTLTQPHLGSVLEAVGSVSLMLGGKTLVEIRDFPLLANASKDAGTDAQLEELKALLESTGDNKVVLFVATKLDVRLKFPKWLTKHKDFEVRKFEAFKFWETDKVADFLVGYARHHGGKLAHDAADALATNLGTDLRLLTSEVDKLMLFALDRPITAQDVYRMGQHGDNLFPILQRWIAGERAADNYRDLAETLLRRHPVEVFAPLQTYFNNLFRTAWLANQGLSPDAIAQRTGQKPFSVKKNLDQFRRVPGSRWLHLKARITDLEWQTKTGRLDGRLALEALLGS